MFKNLLTGATSKMMTNSAVVYLLATGLVVSSAVAVTSTYNSGQHNDRPFASSLQAESSGKSHVTIGSNSVWPASQESTSVDIVNNKQDNNPTDAAAGDSGSDSQSGTEVDKDGANSDSAAVPQVENSSGNSSKDNNNESDSGDNGTQGNQSPQSTGDNSSSQPQPSGYNYLLNVSGYCDGGWECAQAAVNSYSLSYIYYASNFQMIAGHNYGEAGVIANFAPGDVIKVTGNGAGLYRITHTQWMEYTTEVQQVGGQFAFQTCVGSKMLHAYAVRIG